MKYHSGNIGCYAWACGTGTWKPGIVALIKHCKNGLRLNVGSFFVCFMWPLRNNNAD